MFRNLKVDLVNGGIKKARVSQGGKEYDIESISAGAGEAQQVKSDVDICSVTMNEHPPSAFSWLEFSQARNAESYYLQNPSRNRCSVMTERAF